MRDECAKKDNSDCIKVKERSGVVEKDKVQEHGVVDSIQLLLLSNSSLVHMLALSIGTILSRAEIIGSALRFEVAHFFVCN